MPPPTARPGVPPDRAECVEQAHFFALFRDRVAENLPSQDILARVDQEVLPGTKLPYAIQFLTTELRHSGRLSYGFAKLPHYFTPFQAFVVKQAEEEKTRLTMPVALSILENEAKYKADAPTPAGLFVFQFESIARNRLGYDEGLRATAADPFLGPDWADYVELVRRQAGTIDFCDLVYIRSELYVRDQTRKNPGYEVPVPVLYGEREGRIAQASRGRDPLFLFAALQRQLGYPEVPRLKPRDDTQSQLEILRAQFRDLEARLRMVESENRGTFDPTQFGKPTMFRDLPDAE